LVVQFTIQTEGKALLTKLLLKIGACLTISVLFVGLSFQGTAYAKNTSIHVHIKGDADQVTSVSVKYKDRYIKLKKKSTKLYSEYKKLAGTAEIVKDDISKIIVTTVEGTLYFEPAINYAGEEGKGTINYWIEIKSGSGDDVSEDKSNDKTNDSNDDSQGESDGKTDDTVNSNSTDDKKDTDSKTPTTVTGGKLPETSTPWYNCLLISSLIALSSGGVLLISKRLTK
jgi:hypothetical protein